MKKNVLLIFALGIFMSMTAFAQDHTVSIAGQLGWSSPGGDGVGEEAGKIDVDGGLSYGADVLYHLMDGKLGVGLAYTGTILASVDSNLDAFGMTVIGAKGLYSLKSDGFTPFAGLTLGMMKLSTPEFKDGNGNVLVASKSGSAFAIQPTLGLSFGGFYMAVDYLVPGKITIDGTTAENAIGHLTYNLGYRRAFQF